MDKFLTIKELAAILKVSGKTILNMIKAGQIKAVPLSGTKRISYRIYEKDLERFMAESFKSKEA